eukprot:GHVR01132388.1.p1 GENE.GHVR01132388.1~~GHVR01132388.1.p1  ORF type:complete len:465 (-),score=154.28 GHVR01132388.1:173-1567(-)
MSVTGPCCLKQTVLKCNREGMDYLQTGDLPSAYKSLKHAELQLSSHQTARGGYIDPIAASLYAVTCNNLGCYFKRVGKLENSLVYLQRALQVEEAVMADEVTMAGTHLNVCAILSKLGHHTDALRHADTALHMIRKRVQDNFNNTDINIDDATSMAIAYHNCAVEQEFLGDTKAALSSFRQGHEVALKSVGEAHTLTRTLGFNADALMSHSKLHKKCTQTDGPHRHPTQQKSSHRPKRPQTTQGRDVQSAGDINFIEFNEKPKHGGVVACRGVGGRVSRVREDIEAAQTYNMFKESTTREKTLFKRLKDSLWFRLPMTSQELQVFDTLRRAEETRTQEELIRLKKLRAMLEDRVRGLQGGESNSFTYDVEINKAAADEPACTHRSDAETDTVAHTHPTEYSVGGVNDSVGGVNDSVGGVNDSGGVVNDSGGVVNDSVNDSVIHTQSDSLHTSGKNDTHTHTHMC